MDNIIKVFGTLFMEYIEKDKPKPSVDNAPCKDCGEITERWVYSYKMNEITFRCEECAKNWKENQKKMQEEFIRALLGDNYDEIMDEVNGRMNEQFNEIFGKQFNEQLKKFS